MLIRVVEALGDENKDVATIESTDVPAKGDIFWWKTNGPYEVVGRTWRFPPGFIEERPEVVTLKVQEVNKHK